MTTTTNPFFTGSPFWNNAQSTWFGGWIPPFNGFTSSTPTWNTPYGTGWNTQNAFAPSTGFNPFSFTPTGSNPFNTQQSFNQFPTNQFPVTPFGFSPFGPNQFGFGPFGLNPFGFSQFGPSINPFFTQNSQPFNAWFQPQPTPSGFQPFFQSTFNQIPGPQAAWWTNPSAFVGPTINPQNTDTPNTTGVPVFFTPGFGFAAGPFNFNQQPGQQAA